jgi:hypothetical protein
MSKNLEVALAHARAGIFILPCHPTTRAPLIKNWNARATTDLQLIAHWWTAEFKDLDPLPGRACGRAGQVVIDLDRKPGNPDGVNAFYALATTYEESGFNQWPVTFSPNNGIHITFQMPATQLGNRVGALPPGIDVRGLGGYVLCEGATFPDGRTYVPAQGQGYLDAVTRGNIPPMPEWLFNTITAAIPGRTPDRVDMKDCEPETERHEEFYQSAVKRLVEQLGKAKEGEGNTRLNQLAFALGQWHGCGWGDWRQSADALYEHCMAHGWYSDEPQTQDARLTATILSGIRSGHRDPGGILLRQFRGDVDYKYSYAAIEHGKAQIEAVLNHQVNHSLAITAELAQAFPDEAEPDGEFTEAELAPRFRLELPPGYAGRLAWEFMNMMHYPNQTAAVAWAIHVISGLAQRSYHIDGVGLNTYIMVLAETGSGKDGQVTARDQLFRDLQAVGQMGAHIKTDLYYGPGSFASGQALRKHVMKHMRCASMLNEASFLFQQIGGKGADPHAAEIRRAILGLKTKAGPGGREDGYAYSDDRNNVDSCPSPSLSLLCEGQPDRLYRALNAEQAEDGIINRFEFFDATTAARGKRNKNRFRHFSVETCTALMPLVTTTAHASPTGVDPTMKEVGVYADAEAWFDKYEEAVLDRLSSGRDRLRYQIFNRSLVTAKVYAALLAVLDNPHEPKIHAAHAQWALDLVYRERASIHAQFATGDVGGGHNQRVRALIKILRRAPKWESELLTKRMKDHACIPWWLFLKKVKINTLFQDDGFKTSDKIIDEALETLVRAGNIRINAAGADVPGVGVVNGQSLSIISLAGLKDD